MHILCEGMHTTIAHTNSLLDHQSYLPTYREGRSLDRLTEILWILVKIPGHPLVPSCKFKHARSNCIIAPTYQMHAWSQKKISPVLTC